MAFVFFAFLAGLFPSCKKSISLEGRWASVTTGAIYEFSKKDFILSTSVLNSAIMVRGTYRSSSKQLVTKAEEISFDFGETWQKNDGSLILKSESDSELISIDEGKISLAGVEYVKF